MPKQLKDDKSIECTLGDKKRTHDRTVMEGGKDKENKKKHKKRMKAIHAKIREQMEFYFSDSNLARDRFMKQLINKSTDGYVDLTVFMNFNKIKSITMDVEVIRKALSHSSFFQFNEEKTKVKRSKPFTEPKCLDDRTVYVECLPNKVDHEWIKTLFSGCGKVTYVSLPKYKTTADPKGFAFVEFETNLEAEKACQELNNPPAELSERPGRFPRSNKQIQYLQEKIGDFVPEDKDQGEVTPSEEKKIEEKLLESPSKSRKSRKRRRQTSESSVDGTAPAEVLKKRRSTQSSEALSSDDKLSSKESSETDSLLKKKRKSSGRESIEGNVQKESSEQGKSDSVEKSNNQNKGKKRKHESNSQSNSKESDSAIPDVVDNEDTADSKIKKRKLESEDTTIETSENDTKKTPTETNSNTEKKKTKRQRKKKHKDKSFPELRVIPKKEWLLLRKEYLNLQKQSMKELKQTLVQLKKSSSEDQGQVTKEKSAEGDSNVIEVPGAVVRVQSDSAFTRNQIKNDLGSGVNIAYVDANDGDKDGYIRFNDSESASTVAFSTTSPYLFTLLTGEEELSYWKKLHADRAAKRNTKVKKKKNGQQKLIDKAQKINKENLSKIHIKFDD